MEKLSCKKEYRFPGSIYFRYAGNITDEDAIELQKGEGYHPSGYGFYGFKCENDITTWNCSNSCD